jgi:hypothetical protein
MVDVTHITFLIAISLLGAWALYLLVGAVLDFHKAWKRRQRRPWDYEIDGECTNSSHPRVLR